MQIIQTYQSRSRTIYGQGCTIIRDNPNIGRIEELNSVVSYISAFELFQRMEYECSFNALTDVLTCVR